VERFGGRTVYSTGPLRLRDVAVPVRSNNILGLLSLPVALPLAANRVVQGGSGRQQELLTIADPTVVVASRHFLCVGVEVAPGDPMVRPDLCATKAGEETFRHVRVGFGVSVLDRVIDPLGLVQCRVEMGVKTLRLDD